MVGMWISQMFLPLEKLIYDLNHKSGRQWLIASAAQFMYVCKYTLQHLLLVWGGTFLFCIFCSVVDDVEGGVCIC